MTASRIPPLNDLLALVLRLLLAAAALVLAASWLTTLLAPRPHAALPVVAQAGVAGDGAARLFGAAAGPAEPAAAMAGLRLTGIWATPTDGFATFQTPRGAISVVPGREVQPGTVLSRLHPDHVILLAGGRETRMPLRADTSLRPATP